MAVSTGGPLQAPPLTPLPGTQLRDVPFGARSGGRNPGFLSVSYALVLVANECRVSTEAASILHSPGHDIGEPERTTLPSLYQPRSRVWPAYPCSLALPRLESLDPLSAEVSSPLEPHNFDLGPQDMHTSRFPG